MSTSNHTERPVTPPMPFIFSPAASPSSSLGTSPSHSSEPSLSPLRQKRSQRTISSRRNSRNEGAATELTDSESIDTQVPSADTIEIDTDIIYNSKTVKYMKVIERYQELLGREIELPRLVLAGAQSSGKSSLLENLTGLPVPIAGGIGTRFPIEITLIESPVYGVKASILPDFKESLDSSVRAKIDWARVGEFKREYKEPLLVGQFEKLLYDASKILGLPEPLFAKDQKLSESRQRHTISAHTLRIEMKGPQFKNLSLVDTPGLYEAGNSEQDGESAPLIKNLVFSLISSPRTIIIAVMNGTESTARQSLFNDKVIKTAEGYGDRTIGVMTRCDTLSWEQDHDVQRAINRAAGKEFHLTRGWYVVKNRSSTEAEKGVTLAAARDAERTLFSTPPWAPSHSGLSPSRMGIDNLRLGLSDVFCQHIRDEFPRLKAETLAALALKREELAAMGPPRSESKQQLAYLSGIVEGYRKESAKCLVDDRRKVCEDDPMMVKRHIRTTKMVDLKEALETRGMVWKFETVTGLVDLVADKAANALLDKGVKDGEGNIYTWINTRFQSSKSCEVPGLVPYELVERLFEEQTENWVSNATTFAGKVKSILKSAVEHCLEKVCSNKKVSDGLISLVQVEMDFKMDEFLQSCLRLIEHQRRGMEIVASKELYERDLKQARTQRFMSAIARLESTKPILPTGGVGAWRTCHEFMFNNAEKLLDVLTDERQAVYQIHDILKAYYSLSLMQYIGSVCKNLLNISFVEGFMDVFSMNLLGGLSEGEVDRLVGESAVDKDKRKRLEEDIKKYELAVHDAEEILRERV